jgi:hypothetical protein
MIQYILCLGSTTVILSHSLLASRTNILVFAALNRTFIRQQHMMQDFLVGEDEVLSSHLKEIGLN